MSTAKAVFVRKIQNTVQDFQELRFRLGLPPEYRVGFVRTGDNLRYEPFLEHDGKTWRVGDIMPEGEA